MNPIPPDAATINLAKHQRDDAIIHGTVTFVAVATGYGLLRAAIPPIALDPILHFATGFHFDPLKRVRPPSPTGALKLYLLPAPAGVIPPELYGLEPDYVKDFAPSLPQSSLLANTASKERKALFEAEQEVDRIISRAAGRPGQRSTIATRILLADLAYLHGLGAPVGDQLLGPPRSELALRTVERELIDRGVLVPLRQVHQTQPQDFQNLGKVFGVATVAGGIQTTQLPRPVAALPPILTQPTATPLPLDTPPASVQQQEATKRANDLVKHILSERADP